MVGVVAIPCQILESNHCTQKALSSDDPLYSFFFKEFSTIQTRFSFMLQMWRYATSVVHLRLLMDASLDCEGLCRARVSD
jgi:hypothetical protein